MSKSINMSHIHSACRESGFLQSVGAARNDPLGDVAADSIADLPHLLGFVAQNDIGIREGHGALKLVGLQHAKARLGDRALPVDLVRRDDQADDICRAECV